MRNFKFNLHVPLAIAACAALSFFTAGCDNDDDEPKNFELTSAMIGDADLNGATFATDVDPSENIVVVFTDNVDQATATNGNIKLMLGDTEVPATITVSDATITVDPTDDLITGSNYDFTVSSAVKSTSGKIYEGGLTTSFTTEGIGLDTPPQAESQVLYIQFDGDISDVAGTHETTYEQGISYTEDRFGVAGRAAQFDGAAAPGQGDLAEISGDELVNASTTISVWFKVAEADYEGSRFMFGTAVEKGYFLEVGSGGVDWLKFATNHKVDASGTPDHNFATAWTDPNGDGTVGGQTLFDFQGSISDLTTDKWTHLVMTFDASSSLKTIFLDGQKIMQVDIDMDATEWILKDLAIATMDDAGNTFNGLEPVLALGYAGSRGNTATDWANFSTSTNSFKGAMDDFRIFDKALSESEVLTLFNSEKAD